jgi:hypothetical protein
MRQTAGPHVRAVRRDLRRLPVEDRAGGTAQVALSLARWLDLVGDEFVASARDVAAVSRELHAVLLTLAKKQEPAEVLSPIDELRRRREVKLRDASG